MTRIHEARICQRCIMRDIDDPDITFDAGVCNHCTRYDRLAPLRLVADDERDVAMDRLLNKIRQSGRNKEYDCLVGVSGGVDSTYVLKKVVEFGLRPLAVHVDNGWNSEAAVHNIEYALHALGVELHTEVLDLREFYELQKAFLRASVPDGDIPADHAIQATLWKVARKQGIKYIMSGMNFRTESLDVPSWSYGHSDWKYIHAVHGRFSSVKLRKYPHFGIFELLYTNVIRRVRIISLLNYLEYDKNAAKAELQAELGWKPYDGKHYESIFTRYYQGYYLPKKFNIDKRRGHLSDLIRGGLLSRVDALEQMSRPDYDENLRRDDQALFLKKLRLSEDDLDSILATPPLSFRDYPNTYEQIQRLRRAVNWLRAKGIYPR